MFYLVFDFKYDGGDWLLNAFPPSVT